MWAFGILNGLFVHVQGYACWLLLVEEEAGLSMWWMWKYGLVVPTIKLKNKNKKNKNKNENIELEREMELREGDGFDAWAVDDVKWAVEAPEIPIREWPNHYFATVLQPQPWDFKRKKEWQ